MIFNSSVPIKENVSADKISYDNTTTDIGFSATTVQGAIDEIATFSAEVGGEVDDVKETVKTIQTEVSNKQDKITGATTQVVGFDADGNLVARGTEDLVGPAGSPAKINGVNTLTLQAGSNVEIEQDGEVLTINVTGVMKVVPVSLEIATPPNKTSYLSGESFDATGMVVEVSYSDGKKSEVTGYSWTPNGALEDGITEVTIQYSENGIMQSVKQPITVTPIIRGLRVTTPPSKTVYELGQAFAPAGMVVTATYSDGTSKPVTGYSTAPATFSALGSQSVTVTYTENGITKTAETSVTVERITLPAVPTQQGTLTYNGNTQTVVLSGYDADKMSLGGDTVKTNAGSYTATVTPTENYRWPDGTTAAKNVPWRIGKAAGSLTVSTASLSLTNSAKTGTITANRAGDGKISANSSNSSVATATIDRNTVTVTGVGNGTATITISVGEGGNHTAPESKIVSVSVALNATASTAATEGVTYTSGISAISPEKLSEYSKAISNNAAITNKTSVVYIDDGNARYKVSVGDEVVLTYSSTVRVASSSDGNEGNYTFVILGFNHDDLGDLATYGAATATGKAGITFQMKNCLKTTYRMNSTNTNAGGWDNCALRTNLNNYIKRKFPPAWQNIIKKVKKKTSAGSQSSNISTTEDDLFLLSEIEIFDDATYSVAGEGNQYAWYKAGNSKAKTVNGSASNWWERSPHTGYSSSFCFVSSTGATSYNGAISHSGVCFGFCV